MAPTSILTVNAGSTSTKLVLLDDTDTVTWSRTVTADPSALRSSLEEARRGPTVTAVGHRIVHGGTRFLAPVLIDDRVLAEIGELTELAPLHNQVGLDGIVAARAAFPDVAHVACFDTAFHATIPPAAHAYGGPRQWLDQGYRRYGFHGLSNQHAVTRAAELLGRPPADLHLVSCHLGGGCSATAIASGHSVDTTMGYTPLEGLVMATRAGSVDPGLIVHLLSHGVGLDELDDMLEHRSGLLGLSDVSSDLRTVTAARDGGNADARLAVDVFVHRVASGIGAMIGALDRLDAVVFTGGIGENDIAARAEICAGLGALGIVVDPTRNNVRGEAVISADNSPVKVRVIPPAEDLIIVNHVVRLLG